MADTLYIFLDESGDFTFSEKGTDYLILTAAVSFDAVRSREMLIDLKYKFWREGHNIEYFHASEDAQVIRNGVYDVLESLDCFEVHSIVVEKRKVNPALHRELDLVEDTKTGKLRVAKEKVEERIYKQACSTLLKYLFKRIRVNAQEIDNDRIIVVPDKIMTNKKRDFVTKHIKELTKAELGIIPHVYFHSTKSDLNAQIADYCGWAIFRKWEDGELRPYEKIKSKIQNEFDIFKKGTSKYY